MAVPSRLPWEIVETLPSTDQQLLDEWEQRVAAAPTDGRERVEALVGRALSRYWAVQMGLVDLGWEQMRNLRASDVAEATEIARTQDDPDTLATALLGGLYALWGPEHSGTDATVDELLALRDRLEDEELGLRVREWSVIRNLLHGDLAAVDAEVAEFSELAQHTELPLFRRRTELWQSNLAMLRGEIDEAVRINQGAISSTADTAGSPFSFQNVAVTMAIERFLRRGLGELVEAVRSIRASSPRVGANWDVGLAFTLSESGQLQEAAGLFDPLAAEDFGTINRDLNWAPTMNLVALIAINLDRRAAMSDLLDLLEPLAELDTTHGAGYASYGPMGRVTGMLAARLGRNSEALEFFDRVLDRFEAGPWTALTRLERARALKSAVPQEALNEAVGAEAELRSFDMSSWAGEARQLAIELRLEGHGDPVAVFRDGVWILRHRRGRAELADGVGVNQLLRLLGNPGMPIDAIDLDDRSDASLQREAVKEPLLDQAAVRALRDRLRRIEAEGEDSDPGLASEAAFIRRELAGGAFAPSSSAELERARVRVTKAIRRTVSAISDRSPGLGRHLEETVSTGSRCLYAPGDANPWEVLREPPSA